MKVNTALVLSAITLSSFVDADAFVNPSHNAFKPPITRQTQTKPPLTAAGRPASKVVLNMSGGGGEAVSTEGTATIPDEIFNLVKSIVGAGVLSLPAGKSYTSIFKQSAALQSKIFVFICFINCIICSSFFSHYHSQTNSRRYCRFR